MLNILKHRYFKIFLLFIFYLITSYFYFKQHSFTFDEPHYLLAAYSILRDCDFDLKNNYENEDYTNFYSGDLDPHISPNSVSGKWYSIHGYGLSFLLVPVFITTQNIHYKVGILLSILSTAGYLLLCKAWSNAYSRFSYSGTQSNLYFSGQIILFSLFVINPILIFTKFIAVESTAFLFVCYVVWLISRDQIDCHNIIFVPFLAGLLLFFHVKFFIVSLGSLLTLWFIFREKMSFVAHIVYVLMFSVPLFALLQMHHYLYGSFSLNAQYASGALAPTYLLQAIFGFFFDGHTGLIFVAPIYIMLGSGLAKKIPNDPFIRKLCLLLILVGFPLIIISGFHVLTVDQVETKKNIDFIQAWFIDTKQIPMWFQTPASRFLLPILPIFVMILSRIIIEMTQYINWRISIFFLLSFSFILSFMQVCIFPHTLFRPGADFESFAPLWGWLLKEWSWIIPNLLSFSYPLENIFLVLFWFGLFMSYFYLLEKKWTISMLCFGLSFGYILAAVNKIEFYNEPMSVPPIKMRTNINSGMLGKSRHFWTDMPVSKDLIYGPYIYVPAGDYCVTLDINLVGTYSYLKWYIADALTNKLHSMQETFLLLSDDRSELKLCFKNITPHYPKEFKIYGRDFHGLIILHGISIVKSDS